MHRIPGVGLDPVPGRARQFRGRHDLAPHPGGAHRPGQPVPRRASLVGHRDRPRQATDPVQHHLRIRAQPGLEHLARDAVDRCCRDRACVHVQPDTRTLCEHRGLLHLWKGRAGGPCSVTHEHVYERPRPATTTHAAGSHSIRSRLAARAHPADRQRRQPHFRWHPHRARRVGSGLPGLGAPGLARHSGSGPSGHRGGPGAHLSGAGHARGPDRLLLDLESDPADPADGADRTGHHRGLRPLHPRWTGSWARRAGLGSIMISREPSDRHHGSPHTGTRSAGPCRGRPDQPT